MGYVDQYNWVLYENYPKIKSNNPFNHIRLALLRMMVVNAFRIYNAMTKESMSQTQFLVELMRQLLGYSKIGWNSLNSHRLVSTQQRRVCSYCHTKHNRSNTTLKCTMCEKFMHKRCFIKFHNK